MHLLLPVFFSRHPKNAVICQCQAYTHSNFHNAEFGWWTNQPVCLEHIKLPLVSGCLTKVLR
jgi:hypothetical protein